MGGYTGMTGFPGMGGGMPQGQLTVASMTQIMNFINDPMMPESWRNGAATVMAQAWMNQNGGMPQGSDANTLNMLKQMFGPELIQLAQAIKNGNISSGQTSLPLSNQLSADEKDWGKTFDAMDQRNGNGNVDWKEYLNYYIQDKEKQLGKTFMNTNSPEYKKYYQEALNMFNAMATPTGKNGNRVITRENFGKMMSYFDKMDGSKDGNIDANIYNRAIAQIKEYGDDAIISNGQTLRELMG